MIRKYKIKRKRKVSLFLIFIIIMVSFVFMSYGYALYSEKLKMNISANIDPNYAPRGKSTYSVSTVYSWGSGTPEAPLIHQIKMPILNLDGDLSEWVVTFETQEGIVPSTINCWAASSIEVVGNTVTMVCEIWNAGVQRGGTINIEFQIGFDNPEPLEIKNVTLNGLLISLEETES